jgi:predicted metal-dependent phosphotriesterase family hydrolase
VVRRVVTASLGTTGPRKFDSVRTVLGDMPMERLGRCDYHEHLFQVSPLLVGDELDDEQASTQEAESLRQAGIDAFIDATPTGLGRKPGAVARISHATGIAVVHVSGAHHQGHYGSTHWLLEADENDLINRFLADVRDGLPAEDGLSRGDPAVGPTGDPVRAGMLKAGIGYWRISPFERRVLAAVTAAALLSGVPVMIHLEHGSATWELLDILMTGGLTPDRVVLAHIDRNLDPGLHADLTLAGAYLGYDGMARHREAPDAAIIDCLERVVATGDASRLVLGGDVARRTRYLAYGGMPGLEYLPRRFLPRLRDRLGLDVVDRLLIENPARLLTIREAQ